MPRAARSRAAQYGALVVGTGASSIGNAGLITASTGTGILLASGGTVSKRRRWDHQRARPPGFPPGTVTGYYPVSIDNSGPDHRRAAGARAWGLTHRRQYHQQTPAGTISGDLTGIYANRRAGERDEYRADYVEQPERRRRKYN